MTTQLKCFVVVVGTGTNTALPSNLDFFFIHFFLPCNFPALKSDFEGNPEEKNVAFLERENLQFMVTLYKIKALRPEPNCEVVLRYLLDWI